MALDRNEVKKKLAEMKPRQWLYEDIKQEMAKRGHWKQLPRNKGNAEHFKKAK